ncbi:uncharacterized protein [Asterias amurensis]|uniref:uncharacterized protein n=1 Tax=Asterias amurensis TaxID=7602 RepID=UPI003AB1F6E8
MIETRARQSKKNFGSTTHELGRMLRVGFFVMAAVCLVAVWCVHTTEAVSADSETETPVNQQAVPPCVTCDKHEQLVNKLNNLKESARGLNHRVEKVGSKLDNLEDCSCTQ